MSFVNCGDDIIIEEKVIPLLKEKEAWIKQAYDVGMKYGNQTSDDKKQWVSLIGEENERSVAKVCFENNVFLISSLDNKNVIKK